MKVIIVGGVAGGASCAARLRRLDEKPGRSLGQSKKSKEVITHDCNITEHSPA
jgi:hypothetical protein